ncbi:UNVERIFIED_CONTAM: hypothetical protein Slati_3098300 [Sesamum latifolium]|uniref:Uncharacterized protein n=1 Tax=Sesamum latifolium TaxID=2727402 RepID=A0AAW2UUB9_9LAMI
MEGAASLREDEEEKMALGQDASRAEEAPIVGGEGVRATSPILIDRCPQPLGMWMPID